MKWILIGNNNIRIPSVVRILFPYKEKKLFWMPNNKMLYLVLQNKLSIIFINWLFQGMMGFSKIDLMGKFIFELICFIIVMTFLGKISITGVISVLLIAHTLNWIFNTHFWVIGRYIGITNNPTCRHYNYLKKLQKRILKTNAFNGVIVLGGASRGEGVRKNSDVDIFFISNLDMKSKLIAVLLTIKERITAFLTRYPLDLYLYEKVDNMMKHRKDEVPFLLYDSEKKVEKFYKSHGRHIAYLENFPK